MPARSPPSLMDLPSEIRFQIFDHLISLPHLIILLDDNPSSPSPCPSDLGILAPLSQAHPRLASAIEEWARVAITSASLASAPGISRYENCPRLGIFNSETTFVVYHQERHHRTDEIRATWTVVMTPVSKPGGLAALLRNPGSMVEHFAKQQQQQQQQLGRGRERTEERQPFFGELVDELWVILRAGVFWDKDAFGRLMRCARFYWAPAGRARVVVERRHLLEFSCLV